mmetsp:Transcript_4931/g.8565  ORF Transcript_4931/g.8565 Transcript_4931/m.8565 type:complete len:887 (-) Transcript_4931:1681-4341(-)
MKISALGQKLGTTTKASTQKLTNVGKRVGKTPARFQFDIILRSIHGLKSNAIYFIKWTRGVRVARSVNISPTSTNAPISLSDKLSLLVSLFYDDSQQFDEKDSKISVVRILTNERGKTEERTVAKTHFDLSQYAGMPSKNTPTKFALSDTVSLELVIGCKYIGAGDNTTGDDDTSSLSGLSYANSSTVDSRSIADDLADLDDLDDLLDGDDEIDQSSTLRTMTLSKSQMTNSSEKPMPRSSSSAQSNKKFLPSFKSFSNSKTGQMERSKTTDGLNSHESAPLGKPRVSFKGVVSESAHANDQRECDELRTENEVLKTRLKEEQEKLKSSTASQALLEQEIERLRNEQNHDSHANVPTRRGSSTSTEVDAQLKKENAQLKRQIAELQIQVKRLSTENEIYQARDKSEMMMSLQRVQDELFRENSQLRKENEGLAAELEEMEEKMETLEYNQSRSTSQRIGQSASSQSNLEMLVESKDSEIMELQARIRQVEIERDASTKALKEARASQTSSRRERELEVENDRLVSENAKLEAGRTQIEASLAAKARALDDLRTKHNELQKSTEQSRRLIASGNNTSSDSTASRARTLQLEKEVQRLNTKLAGYENGKGSTQNNTEDVESLKSALEKSNAVNRSLSSQLEEQNIELEQLHRDLDRHRRSVASSSASISEREKEHQMQLEELREERARAERRSERLRKDAEAERDEALEALENIRKQRNAQVTALREELDSALQNRAAVESRATSERIERLENELTMSNRERKQLKLDLEARQQLVEESRNELTKVRMELGNVRFELSQRNADMARTSGITSSEDNVVQQLVEAKLRMADMEEENTRYKNIIQKMNKGNASEAQRRIAEHASKLEVRLTEANSKIDTLQLRIAKLSMR